MKSCKKISDQISDQIKKRRAFLGLSQKKLAGKVGVSVTTIQNYESGAIPKGIHLISLSQSLSCSIDWLLTGQGPIYNDKGEKVSDETFVDRTTLPKQMKEKIKTVMKDEIDEIENKLNFRNKLDRLKTTLNCKTDSELATILNIKQQSIAGAKKRKKLPSSWIEYASVTYNCSANWLFFGEGAMYRDVDINLQSPNLGLADDKMCITFLVVQAIHELNNGIYKDDKLTIRPEKFDRFIKFIEENAWSDWKETVQDLIEALLKALPHLKK